MNKAQLQIQGITGLKVIIQPDFLPVKRKFFERIFSLNPLTAYKTVPNAVLQRGQVISSNCCLVMLESTAEKLIESIEENRNDK